METTITPMPIPNLACFFTGTLLLLPNSIDASILSQPKDSSILSRYRFGPSPWTSPLVAPPVSSRKHRLHRASLRRPSACRIHRARTVSRCPGSAGTPIAAPQSSPELFPMNGKSAPRVWDSPNYGFAPPPPPTAAPSTKKAPSSCQIRFLPGIPKCASEKIPRAETQHAWRRPSCLLWKRPQPPATPPLHLEIPRSENRETPHLFAAMHRQEKVSGYERAGIAWSIPGGAADARYVPRKRSGRNRHTAARLSLSSRSECSGTPA